MSGQTVYLWKQSQRDYAKSLIDAAPSSSVCIVRERTRSQESNDKMWAMLTDISRQRPQGIKKTPDQWKCLMMHACGWAVQFETGLNGEPFPVGYRSSRLSVGQMSDLIEFMYQYGAEQGIVWSEPESAPMSSPANGAKTGACSPPVNKSGPGSPVTGAARNEYERASR